MQDKMKRKNIRIIGIPEGEEEEQGIENLFEKVIMENFPNLMREKVTQIQETQRVPSKQNPKGPLQDTSYSNGKIPRQRENIKGCKGETGSNIQGSPNKFNN